jgi:SAM-dependent methyltransferase
VVAVDGSGAMLERAAARIDRLGLATRVGTRRASFPDGLHGLGPADLVWASMVLHHVGDEVDALGRMRALLEPGGLLALVEHHRPVRVLPDAADLGRPGIWDRLDDAWRAWFADMRAELPDAAASADPASMLELAGFELLRDDVVAIDLEPPLDEPARRFARRHIDRDMSQLAPYADPDDLAAVEALADDDSEHGILRRDDTVVRAARRLLVAAAAG